MRNLLFLLMLACSLTVNSEPYYKSELVFPLENWHNHASSLVECPNGNLLVVWFHGSGERRNDDVVIRGAKKAPGAEQWGDYFLAADTPEFPDCNPTLYIDSNNKLWIFWANIVDNRWESALLKYRTATPDGYQELDKGIDWDWQGVLHLKPDYDRFVEILNDGWDKFKTQYADRIPDYSDEDVNNLGPSEGFYYFMEKQVDYKLQQRIGWMPRISPVELSTGRIILPLYTDAYSISLMAYTDDVGKTWQTSEPIVGFGNIQPSVIEKKDGTLVAYMRENGLTDRIRVSESTDGGHSWSFADVTDFQNPGASVEVLHLENGNWLLVYNDTTRGRHNFKLSLSDDEGKTWKWHRYLENLEPGEGSFSYPSLIQTKDGMIHITYSVHMPGGMKSIKHCEFNEEWVKAGDEE